METQYTVDYAGGDPAQLVAIWEMHDLNNTRRSHYINKPSGDLDPASQRFTRYGVRGSGQGEDNVVHHFIGWARIVRVASRWEPIYCDMRAPIEDVCPDAQRDRYACPGHSSIATVQVEMLPESASV